MIPVRVRRIAARDVDHRLGALPVRHLQRALLQQRGRQEAAAAFAAGAPTAAAAAAFHAAVDGHGQRRAGRHQGLAGQRHQSGGSDRGHRAHHPVQSVVVLFFPTYPVGQTNERHYNINRV